MSVSNQWIEGQKVQRRRHLRTVGNSKMSSALTNFGAEMTLDQVGISI
jgi:hypothetical protein